MQWERVGGFSSPEPQGRVLTCTQEQETGYGKENQNQEVNFQRAAASVKEHKKKLLMTGIGDKEACLSLTGVWGTWKKQMKNSKQSLGFPQIKIPSSLQMNSW